MKTTEHGYDDLMCAFLRSSSLTAPLWVVAHPQPVELVNEGPHQGPLLRDHDVLKVALHRCQRPVEGACDESPSVHHGKLVMHVH